MNILFLDFDGVVRVADTCGFIGPDTAQFCADRLRRVKWCCEQTGARIVVSSDWRNLENRAEIEAHLSPWLADLLHEDWATPICGHRWKEVSAWLVRHPEVTGYAILEDFEAHFHGCPEAMADRIVWCNNRYGFVPELAHRLVALFPLDVANSGEIPNPTGIPSSLQSPPGDS
jgi:hypothetical protein